MLLRRASEALAEAKASDSVTVHVSRSDGGDGAPIDTLAVDLRRAMEQPQPRVALGQALRGLATSAIDLSDGLSGDLGHVLRASGVGATVQLDALPRSALLATQSAAMQRLCLLSGGDDYELLFTAPAGRGDAVQTAGRAAAVAVTRCGHIEAAPGLRVVDAAGRAVAIEGRAFDHFAD
jgi:thiamine-monophosphate kinase